MCSHHANAIDVASTAINVASTAMDDASNAMDVTNAAIDIDNSAFVLTSAAIDVASTAIDVVVHYCNDRRRCSKDVLPCIAAINVVSTATYIACAVIDGAIIQIMLSMLTCGAVIL
jgi:hypothetical protein